MNGRATIAFKSSQGCLVYTRCMYLQSKPSGEAVKHERCASCQGVRPLDAHLSRAKFASDSALAHTSPILSSLISLIFFFLFFTVTKNHGSALLRSSSQRVREREVLLWISEFFEVFLGFGVRCCWWSKALDFLIIIINIVLCRPRQGFQKILFDPQHAAVLYSQYTQSRAREKLGEYQTVTQS